MVSASQSLFGRAELSEQEPQALGAALAETDFVELAGADAPGGEISIVDLLVASKLVAGKGAARRMIAEGGAYLNNIRLADPESSVSASDLLNSEWLVLRRGRKTIVGVSAAVLA